MQYTRWALRRIGLFFFFFLANHKLLWRGCAAHDLAADCLDVESVDNVDLDTDGDRNDAAV